MIKRRKGTTTCTVDALAASIATVIASSCDKVYMYKNSMFMIHNASSIVWGNANEMRKMAEDLDRITESIKETYLEKCKKKTTKAEFTRLMDNETWLSADETKELGLCDKVLAENKAVASINSELFKNYKNVPENLKGSFFVAQNQMDDEMKILIKNIKNTDSVFIFPTDTVLNSWADFLIINHEKTNVQAIPMERFIAWDKFKSHYLLPPIFNTFAFL